MTIVHLHAPKYSEGLVAYCECGASTFSVGEPVEWRQNSVFPQGAHVAMSGDLRITITIPANEAGSVIAPGDAAEAWRTICAALTVALCRGELAHGAGAIERHMARATIWVEKAP